jgi:hypothetical protein
MKGCAICLLLKTRPDITGSVMSSVVEGPVDKLAEWGRQTALGP